MIDVETLKDEGLVRFINTRWKKTESLWSEIGKLHDDNKKQWQNQPDYIKNIPRKKSKARDNRIFIAIESVITNLTGRPSKPNAVAGNDTEEAKTIANNLQDYVLERYRKLQMKKTMRKGLRYLFFSRLIVLKAFWDADMDNFNEKAVNPKNIRFYPITATCREEVEVWMEQIDTSLSKMIARFPDKEEELIKDSTFATLEEIQINDPPASYKEVWINDDWVVYMYKNKILKKELNPYWDWEGLHMTGKERAKVGEKPGKKKRAFMTKIRGFQDYRNKRVKAKEEGKKGAGDVEYESYMSNHFDSPRAPYMIGTILEEEDKPIGETSLIEQAIPLQEEIDKRKRQFSDNADMMNGIFKVDTGLVTGLSKAEAKRAHADPRGIWYGKGVKEGVTREVGKELPQFLRVDMIHSIAEVDNIFGTQPTFRGEKGTQETATGRAILREASAQRLNELIDLTDYLHEESYNWWLQFIKTRFTEKHLAKIMGKEKATETIDLMQDDFDEGTEIRVIPGQVLPEDRVYISDRAIEAAKVNMIDPLSFFESQGWEDPMKQAKRLMMFSAQPFSIVDMSDEDIAKVVKAAQMFATPPPEGGGGAPPPEGGGVPEEKAKQVAAIRKEAQDLINSPEFKNMPPEEQRSVQEEIKKRLEAVMASA